MSIYSKEFYKKTMTVWQPFSSSILSEENAREVIENTTSLFLLLSEWEKKDGEKNENNEEEE